MKTALTYALLLTSTLAVPALAQTAEPTYKGDPDVYKLIYEDDKIRVIEALRGAGVTDKVHGHPVKSVVYSITDCQTTQTASGQSVETPSKAGVARAVPEVPSHTATNTGTSDCRQLFIEEK